MFDLALVALDGVICIRKEAMVSVLRDDAVQDAINGADDASKDPRAASSLVSG